MLLESGLVDNREQERLEKYYIFKQEDIMKDIRGYFTNENKQSNEQPNSTE